MSTLERGAGSSSAPVTRRMLLQTTALAAVSLATGCTAGPPPRTTPPSGRRSGTPTSGGSVGSSPPGGPGAASSSSGPGAASSSSGPGAASSSSGPKPADWRALGRSIDGDVVQRGDGGFAAASRLFDPRFDRLQPLAVVEATSAHDVAEAISFGRRFDLPTRPRAGGHSYVGASTVSGGLVLDVGRIRSVHYDAGSSTAHIGAGARLYSVHEELARHGRTIPTGTCPTVGAAGLTLGGGIGVASREHGLTCDRMSDLTIVTADGTIAVADSHTNRDLFWASRGGAGGSFGVVTSIGYHTQPALPSGFFVLSFPWSSAPAVVSGWARRVRVMSRSAWANLHLDAGSDGSTSVRVVGTCRAADQDSEAAAMESAVGVAPTVVSTSARTFLDGVRYLGGGTTSDRRSFAAGSDVIPAMTGTLAVSVTSIVERSAADGRAVSAILDPLTGAVSDVATGASAFPWRNHLCDIQWYVGLPPRPSRGAVRGAYAWIGRAHSAVSSHSEGGYVNYLEPHRPLKSYYGSNYARLRAVKRAADPSGFFRSPYTVG